MTRSRCQVGSRGPKPGSGGRPRKTNVPRRDGYVPATVGPAGRGRKVLQHQVVAGTVGKGPNVTVDHVSGNKSQNTKSNLQVVSRAENVKRENKRRAGKK